MASLSDCALIVATLLGPILAVQAQQWIERARGPKQRRVDVFKTLMASRGAGLSFKHVEALNMIDLEFSGEAFHAVRGAWRSYLDHLSTPQTLADSAASMLWREKTTDLLAKLLGAMATSLGYRFDEVEIKKGAYVPAQHVNDEQEQRQLRLALLSLLAGTTLIKTAVTAFPAQPMTVVTRDERL